MWARYAQTYREQNLADRPEVLVLLSVFVGLALLVIIGATQSITLAGTSTRVIVPAICFAALCGVLSMVRPEWGTLICIIAIPLYRRTIVGSRELSLWEIPLLLTLVSYAARTLNAVVRAPDTNRRTNWLTVIVCCLAVSDALSAWAMYIRSSYLPGMWIRGTECTLVFILVRALMGTTKGIRQVLSAVTIAGCSQAGLGVLQHFGLTAFKAFPHTYPRGHLYWLTHIGWRDALPACGTLGHFNVYGQFMNLCWPAALALILCSEGRARARWKLALVLMIGGLIFSYSRGAMLSAVVSGMLLLLALGRTERMQRVRGITLAALVACVAAALVLGASSEYQETLSLEGREAIWDNLMKGFPADASELFVGRGTLTAGKLSGGQGSHNSYVLVLTEQGLMGIVPFVGLALAMLWPLPSLMRARRSTVRVAAVAAGIAAASFFLHASVDHLWGISALRAQLMVMAALASIDLGSQDADAEQDSADEAEPLIGLGGPFRVSRPPRTDAGTKET